MGDGLGKGAVIGQQQHALRFPVQPSHGIHPFPHILDQVGHTAAVHLIAEGGDVSPRLIQHNIARLLLDGRHLFASYRHQIPSGIDLIPQLDRTAVYFYHPLLDQFLRFAPGSHSPVCQILL